MMLPTHIVVGVAIAAPLLAIAPAVAPAGLLGAIAGSGFPDLDMYTGHRRALHYPTGYTLAAALAVVTTVLVSSPLTTGAAFFLVGAALHCRMDRYGGGLEREPWEANSDRGVYDHFKGRWRRPRRWIRYDGAPEDLLIAIGLGLPLVVVLDGVFRWVTVGALIVATVYSILRRRLAAIAPAVADRVPDPVEPYVPHRYRD